MAASEAFIKAHEAGDLDGMLTADRRMGELTRESLLEELRLRQGQ